MWRSVVVGLVAAGFGFAAGTYLDPSDPPRSTPTPSPSPSPSSTEILQGRACPPGPTAETGCATSTRGDFDGDGVTETFELMAETDDQGLPVSWRWVLRQEDGTEVSRGPFPMRNTATYPEVVGSEDADGAGRDEIFIKLVLHLYHSGGTREVGIFGFDEGRRLVRIHDDEGPFLFPVGGVSRYGEGAECRDVDLDGDPEFVRLRVDYVRFDVQRTSERIYEWRDRRLHLVDEREGRFAKMSVVDPLLRRYYGFGCLGFDPPFPY